MLLALAWSVAMLAIFAEGISQVAQGAESHRPAWAVVLTLVLLLIAAAAGIVVCRKLSRR